MKKDLTALQGTWTVTALEMDGQSMPETILGEAQIVIDGNRFKSTGMGAVYEGTVEIDSSGKTAHIDLHFDAGPEKGTINRGIYKLDRDSWKLCLDTRGGKRPAKFASPSDSGIAVETLVRGAAKPAGKSKSVRKTAPEPAPSGAPTEFEGEWAMVSGVMSGKAMDASMVQWVKRVTTGNITTVVAGPQTMVKVEFTFNPSTSPKQIDYLNLAGSTKGKRQEGIYQLEGGVLSVCVAAPGAARPRNFESAAGDGRTFTVWKRA